MATLVGRECWKAVGHTLEHGVVIEHPDKSQTGFNAVVVKKDDGDTEKWAVILTSFTIESAISSCADQINYWEMKKRELERERERRNK